MFTSTLRSWLITVLSLLIHIDQETILDFLGIDGPFNTDSEDYALLVGTSQISTPVSFETFKLIIDSIWDHYQHGLGFVDIENIALFILVIRFIYLSRKYNLITGFLITCIGLGAGYLWYTHLRDLAYFFKGSVWLCPLTRNLGIEFQEIHSQQLAKYDKPGARFDTFTLYGPAVRGLVELTSNKNYRYDPISMLWSYLPTDFKFFSDKIYYFLTLKAIPRSYRFIDTQLMGMATGMWYTFVVRINKRYCPYLIRWHWTFLFTLEYFERPMYRMEDRLVDYLQEFLIPNEYLREAELVTIILITLVAFNYVFIILSLLHALCGQYFYFPVLTETTDLHIGLRPKDSIYSGGFTIWQNKTAYLVSRQASAKLNKYRSGTIRSAYRIIPRLWYGWLGRGTLDDLTNKEYEQYLKDKNNKELNRKAKHRDSKIRWYYRKQRLKKRFITLITKFGIRINNNNSNDDGNDLYQEFKKFTKK